jgi:hypothetical protein
MTQDGPSEALEETMAPGTAQPARPTGDRFASPPITMRRSRTRRAQPPVTPASWTLGNFLAAATRQLNVALPTPGRRPRRRPLNFAPRRGRSATCTAPPTAERRAHVQILRTLGIIGTDQAITEAELKAYDGIFSTPIPTSVLAAIAALVDRELPSDLTSPATTPSPASGLIAA